MLVLGLIDIPWWAILIFLIIVFYMYVTEGFDHFKNQGVPFVKPYPLLGSMWAHSKMENPIDYDTWSYQTYREKGMVGQYLGKTPSLWIWDEKAMSDVLVKNFASFVNRSPEQLVDPGGLSSRMVGNMSDQEWKHTRNEMTPAFTSGKLRKMNGEINRCAKGLAEYFMQKANDNEDVEAIGISGCFAMDVISSTSFGLNVESLKDQNNIFIKRVKNAFGFDTINVKMTVAVFFPLITKILQKLGFRFDTFSAEAEEFFSGVIKQTMQNREETGDKSRTDFLQLMINAQRGEDIQDDEEKTGTAIKGLDKEVILANALVFFAAGYETTAKTLGFLFYSMATNPECQERLVKEIDEIVGDKEDIDQNLLQQMPYLDQCVNETLRLYPIAPKISRMSKNNATVNGVALKDGTMVLIPVFPIHRDPLIYPDPEKYDPERFTPENKKNRSPFHYMPFGYGPRNCIGMRLALLELKLATIRCLQKVTFTTCEKTQIPLKFAPALLLKPERGIWVKTIPR